MLLHSQNPLLVVLTLALITTPHTIAVVTNVAAVTTVQEPVAESENDTCENYSTSCQTCSEAPKELNCGFYALGDQKGDLSRACMTGSPHGPDHFPTATLAAWGWGERACQSSALKCNRFSHTSCTTCLSSNLRCGWSESSGLCQSSSSPSSSADVVNHLLQCFRHPHLRIQLKQQEYVVTDESDTAASLSPFITVVFNTTTSSTSTALFNLGSFLSPNFLFTLGLLLILVAVCGGIYIFSGCAAHVDEPMHEAGQTDALLTPRANHERIVSNELHRLFVTVMTISLAIKLATLFVNDWDKSDLMSLLAFVSSILSCIFGIISVIFGLKYLRQPDSFGTIQLLVCTACWTFICTCGAISYWASSVRAHLFSSTSAALINTTTVLSISMLVLDFFTLIWSHDLLRQARLRLQGNGYPLSTRAVTRVVASGKKGDNDAGIATEATSDTCASSSDDADHPSSSSTATSSHSRRLEPSSSTHLDSQSPAAVGDALMIQIHPTLATTTNSHTFTAAITA